MADESVGAAVSEPDDSETGRRRRRGAKKTKKQRPFWQELPILIVIAAVIAALMVTFVGRPYVIPSESMEPTLHGCTGCTGDRIYVQKVSYYWSDPKPGDVVVFVGPTQSWNWSHRSIRSDNTVVRGIQNFFSFFGLVPPDENDLVKRVIAVGGQTVQCCDAQGRIMVDGKPLDEPYVKNDFPWYTDRPNQDFAHRGRIFGPITVPPGRLWVMGDNRSNSADSRAHVGDELGGTVPVEDVRGKAVFKIWPPSRIGPVHAQDPQSH
ncbi:signal peptidase I [Nocardia arthritidis]|uniref:Signal peptidase I n=1 Tax=Nocardia arthritidis TaxID=228602 RepID=A0A6G9YN07_9NOCA|nr:signal peptidase I [Nocardia arthritidis]QIS14588.1 signal peptidase I [Nocardia arthritidis]